MNKRHIAWAAALILILVVLVVFLRRDRSGSDTAYREIKVERGDIATTILSTGTVQPENRLEIKPPIAGRVEEVLVKEGQDVHKGDILAWMSSTERAALIDAARSEGKAEVARWEKLYRPTPVIAPINGMIIARNVESGQTFAATDAIFVMSDRLTVKAQVDETDISQIKLKQEAEIVLDAYPDSEIPAVVDQIAYDAKTVNNVTTYTIDVLPKQTPDFMRSGMTANVTFFTEKRENVLVVPSDAIKVDGGSTVVLRPGPGRDPRHETVSTGVTDGKRTEITSGVKEGDIVLAPVYQLKDKTSSGSSPFSPFGKRGGKGRR